MFGLLYSWATGWRIPKVNIDGRPPITLPKSAQPLSPDEGELPTSDVFGSVSSFGPPTELGGEPAADEEHETGALPERIGKFEIERAIGSGAMATVYKGRDPDSQRLVAIKVPRKRHWEQFRREVPVLASIPPHPGVIALYDASSSADSQPYCVMEYIADLDPLPTPPATQSAGPARKAATLLHAASDWRLGWRDRVTVLARLCEAADHIHYSGIVHGDLKPGNVLLQMTKDAVQPKIIDLGGGGTLRYMSPERFGAGVVACEDGKDRWVDGKIDKRADVYALGVVGYELLGGHPPYAIPSDRIGAEHAVRRLPVVPLRSPRGRIQSELQAVLSSALAKHPDHRYDTAKELAQDLERVLGRRPVETKLRRMGAMRKKLYRTELFCRRRPGVAGLLVMLVCATCLAGWKWGQERAARKEAERMRDAATRFVMLHGLSARPPGPTPDMSVEQAVATLNLVLASHGSDAPATLAAAANLAVEFHKAGRVAEAESLARKTLERRTVTLGEDHVHTITSTINLAAILVDLDRTPEAMTLLNRARAHWVLTPDPDAWVPYQAMGTLAAAHERRGELVAAERLNREALKGLQDSVGGGHAAALNVANNLAAVIFRQGRVSEAKELFRNVLSDRREILGKVHPDTLSTATNYAVVLVSSGDKADIEEAERLALGILADQTRVYPPLHREVLRTKNTLGGIFFAKGETDKAEALISEVYEARRAQFGENDSETLGSKVILDHIRRPHETKPAEAR